MALTRHTPANRKTVRQFIEPTGIIMQRQIGEKNREIEIIADNRRHYATFLHQGGFASMFVRTPGCGKASLLLLCIAFLCRMPIAATAQAAYAPGGLFIHPTAFIPPRHHLEVYAAAFTQDEDQDITASYYALSLSYAPTDRLQVSGIAAYHQAAYVASHMHVGPFIKYQLASDTPSHPAFALTGLYLPNDHLETAFTGVFSHALAKNGRTLATVHAGAKWGRMADEHGGMSDFGGFVGLEVPLAREWNLVGETSTRLKFDMNPASSIGVMYHSRSGLNLSLGYVNTGRSNKMKLFFGVGYPFGG